MRNSAYLSATIGACMLGLSATSAAAAPSQQRFMPEQQATLAQVGGLRGRPQAGSSITVPLAAGTLLQLRSRVANGSGIWWYATGADGDGWIPESELVGAQAMPAAVAPQAAPPIALVPVASLRPPVQQEAEELSQSMVQKPYKPFAFVFDLGFEFGGDDVATVFFTDGSSQDIEAGQGITAGLGFSWMPSPNMPFDIRTTLGYKYTTTAANNVDISMSRFMLAVVPTYHLNSDWWVAAGVERHLSTKFDADGLIDSVDFDDATGFTLQAGYKYFAVRYLNIGYKGPFDGEVDGSAIGMLLTITLR